MPTEPSPVPGCSLAGPDLVTRVAEWQHLSTDSLVAREATPAGVRLAFRPDQSVVHHLVDLLDGERRCCGWAEWTLTSTAAATVVEATADPPRVPILHDLFGVTV